jgi:hypothetical protein
VLRLGVRAISIKDNGVQLEGGEFVSAKRVIVATAQREANRLLNIERFQPETSTTCLHYAAPKTPVQGPWLVLNGDGTGPINNLSVLTEVQASYAPEDVSLISVTVLDPVLQTNADVERLVRAQLQQWYGAEVQNWNHLRTDHIVNALPLQSPPALEIVAKPVKLSDRLFVCGDHTTIASIEGAITSGQRAAEAAMEMS